MKPRLPIPARSPSGPQRVRAFTLPEMSMAIGVFGLLMVAMLTSQIFSLRLYNIGATKLGASAEARLTLNRIRDEVRCGKILMVGNAGLGAFTNCSTNQPRRGNALQVFPTTATNLFTCFCLDSAGQQLLRWTNGAKSAEVIARYITNRTAFQAEDFAGNVLTNDQNNRVIKLTLDFYQWECPSATAGSLFNHYHLQTRMTRRTID